MVETIPFAKPYFGPHGMFSTLICDDKTGRTSNGESVRKFEEQVAKISGADYAIACSSCTQGLIIMLASCGAKGTCLQQSFTWDSTLIAADSMGHKILPMEVNYDNWSVKHFPMLPGPGYALAVDTFGVEVNPTSDVPIFFDRAHSFGRKFKNLGIASVLSFSRSKVITTGEGGVILTNKKNFAEAMEYKRDIMSRMPNWCADVGLQNLHYLDDILEWKDSCFLLYKHHFPMFKFQEGDGNHAVIGMLLDSHEQQKLLLTELKDEIEFKAYYEPTHIKYHYPKPLPVTEDIARRIICLPSWYGVQTSRIIRRIKETLSI